MDECLHWAEGGCSRAKMTVLTSLGWENRCWAKISIKSGKAPWLSRGKPLRRANMAKVTVTGPYLSAMTDKIFIDDIWVSGDLNASTCGYYIQWETAGNYTVSELNHKLSHCWSEHL